ncbi:MAG: DUF86 domain-containing protein [candidate division KSB1 bacterium]|nr:DUF86 domain-containing protein [candidate division KSB1 bacterium]MDZ7365475.1 DUF86 domain-containing protein [candidate division KSB1 bacterium]MDZ7403478.1 DUF86 domain-containing protein [candidate division KSB1 bacterium]
MNEPRTLAEIPAILRRHKSVLHAKFGVLDLAVFGSYARQAQQMTSDAVLRNLEIIGEATKNIPDEARDICNCGMEEMDRLA